MDFSGGSVSLRRSPAAAGAEEAPAGRAWLWLGLGALLLPFTAWQTLIPFAAWLAPIFLLRFSRACRSRAVSPLIGVSYAIGTMVATLGTPFNLLGLIGNVILKAMVWSLPYALDRALSRRLGGWARSLVFPSGFVVVDWVLAMVPLSSSGSPAYSQAGNLVLLQVISVTGMWAITFVIMWCAALVNELWERRFQWRSMRGQLAVSAGAIAAVVLFGVLRLFFAAPGGQTVSAAAVTIDAATAKRATDGFDWLGFPRYDDQRRAALRERLDPTVTQMLSRTETALRAGARVVGWQESSGWVLEEDKADVLRRASELARRYGAYLQISLEVFTGTRERSVKGARAQRAARVLTVIVQANAASWRLFAHPSRARSCH